MKKRSAIRSFQRMTVLALASVSVVSFSGCGDAPSTIVLDNGTPSLMQITLNEVNEMELEPHTHKVIHVAPGKHKFKIVSDGKTVFEGTKDIAASSWVGKQYKYLFNPDFSNRYATYDVEYGSGLTQLMEETVEKRREATGQSKSVKSEFDSLRKEVAAMPMSPWFELPSGVDFYFAEPPEQITTRNMSEKRTVLVRTTKQDHAVIRAAASNEAPTEEDFDALYDVADKMWYFPTRPTSAEMQDEVY